MNSRHCRLVTGTRPIQNGPTSTVCAGRSLSSENGSSAASTPSTNGPPGTSTRSPATGRPGGKRPAFQQDGWSLPQLQGGEHGLVVLLLVLHDHARGEQLLVGRAVQHVQHAAADLVVERPGLDGRQQRQRRAVGPPVLERVVQRVHVRRPACPAGSGSPPRSSHSSSCWPMWARSQTSGLISGLCWASSVGSSRSVSSRVRPRASSRSRTMSSRRECRHGPAPRTRPAARPRRCARPAGRPDIGRTRPGRPGRRRPARAAAGARSAAIATQRRAESASAAWPRPSPGRLGPQRGGRLGRLGRLVGRDRVVHQRGRHRGDGRPPARRRHVQVAQLQVAAQPHRREQRGQVDVEVGGGRRAAAQPDRPAGPLLERHARGHGHDLVAPVPDEGDRGGQRVARPRRGRVQAVIGGRGARLAAGHRRVRPRVQPEPGALAGRLPARVPARQPRRARGDGHHRRSEPVGQGHALGPAAGRPASRLTCRAAVEFIMTAAAPPRPVAAMCRSMARYRGRGLTRWDGRAGSAPAWASPRRWAVRARRTACTSWRSSAVAAADVGGGRPGQLQLPARLDGDGVAPGRGGGHREHRLDLGPGDALARRRPGRPGGSRSPARPGRCRSLPGPPGDTGRSRPRRSAAHPAQRGWRQQHAERSWETPPGPGRRAKFARRGSVRGDRTAAVLGSEPPG